ncbi:hypothetical protein C0989_004269 [Termitomyces sp. Mn162]|nr:hypothetical protein C0989_004269 [Termitomyces sp. Mn162]
MNSKWDKFEAVLKIGINLQAQEGKELKGPLVSLLMVSLLTIFETDKHEHDVEDCDLKNNMCGEEEIDDEIDD